MLMRSNLNQLHLFLLYMKISIFLEDILFNLIPDNQKLYTIA